MEKEIIYMAYYTGTELYRGKVGMIQPAIGDLVCLSGTPYLNGKKWLVNRRMITDKALVVYLTEFTDQ